MTRRAAAAAMLLLAAVVRLPTLAHPLTEAHAFRQTQTAFPAVIYARDGIDLLHPQVPVFGPPWSLPFEFPIFQAVAALLIRAGLSVEVATRSLSLAAFLATGFLLWVLLVRHVNERAAMIALAVFLFSPFALLWSRTSMIEYPATLGSVAFMLGVLEWHRRSDARWLALSVVAGTAAALVKVTTGAFWIAPALLTRRWLAVVAVAIPATAAVAWTRYADAVRAANPEAVELSGAAVTSWMLGGDRLSAATWASILVPVGLTAGVLLAPAAAYVVTRRERLVWAWLAIAVLAPPLVFTNVYVRHDYYAAGITPALAALIGGGVDTLLTRLPRLRVLVASAPIAALVLTAWYWTPAYEPRDPHHVLEVAAVIERSTAPGDLVAVPMTAVPTADWSPAYLFYAGRRGLVYDDPFPPPGYVAVPAEALLGR